MDNVIDFLFVKKKKQEEQLIKLFRKANSFQNRAQIDKLVDEKTLTVEDYQHFLAFLAYLQNNKIEPASVFHSVLKMPKHRFEQTYQMNWHSVVRYCLIFLAILKKQNEKQYEQFLSER